MVKADELYDITVVGAGPVGLYAAYYAGLRECRTKLIETYPGKVLLITAGAGEAATAVNTAKESILGDEMGR